ncbi:MAG: SDR family NAD(P)-dependent oxidoreductase [Candidatus Marithrix sp.]
MKILITGVSSGIGQGLLNYYLANGHEVYGISRRIVTNSSANFHFSSLDLSKIDLISPTIIQLLNGIDSLDLVILNAGSLTPFGDIKTTSLEILNENMQINVWVNKLIIDTLLSNINNVKQIVGISSSASQSGNRGWNGYALSKATLNMLMSLYSSEVSATHFSAIAPGLVDTDMQDYLDQLPTNDDYPVLQYLQEARGTVNMPVPDVAAPMLDKAFQHVLSLPSGQYLDVRNLPEKTP